MTATEGTKHAKKEKPVSSSDSNSKVYFSESAVYKYLSGKREPISIRIDTGLYSRFKPLSKRIFGSTCKAVEIYMISLIEAVEKGVHFSDTAKPIHIKKIVIHRNLRARRNLELESNSETSESWTKCCFIDCDKKAVGNGVYKRTGEESPLCKKHLNLASNSLDWRVLDKLP
jgi:hypothetical protein